MSNDIGDHSLAVSSNTSDTRGLKRLIAAFEKRALKQQDGEQFWLARDVADLLRYTDFRNFLIVVEKAKLSCRNSGIDPENHFVDVNEMVLIGSGAKRPIDDIKLSRYACYLCAQNADARKKPVAFAQTYFAVQTRRQELAAGGVNESRSEDEDQRRLLLRAEIKEHNKHLASAAKVAGVVEPLDYAVFQNWGYKGLYGGLDRVGIQRRKGLKGKANILDHMGSTELAANHFRATQTEDKLKRDKIRGKEAANNTHFEVGAKVRETIREIGGEMPEKLPVEEDIKKLARRVGKTGLIGEE